MLKADPVRELRSREPARCQIQFDTREVHFSATMVRVPIKKLPFVITACDPLSGNSEEPTGVPKSVIYFGTLSFSIHV